MDGKALGFSCSFVRYSSALLTTQYRVLYEMADGSCNIFFSFQHWHFHTLAAILKTEMNPNFDKAHDEEFFSSRNPCRINDNEK